MRITREWLRDNNACYTDEKIAGLVPPEGLTPIEVLRRKDTPDADKVWVLTRPDVLTRDVLVAFAKGCAERARGYADAAYADAAAHAAAASRAAAYADAADAADGADDADDAYADAVYADAAFSAAYAFSAADAAAFSASRAASRAAERSAQVKHLIGLLEKEGEK